VAAKRQSKQGREPKAKAGTDLTKTLVPRFLRSSTEVPAGDGYPLFSFRKVDRFYDGEWGWPKLTDNDARALHTFFHECGCKTWNEICAETSGRHRKHHPQPVESLVKEAQQRLDEIDLDDLSELFRFRLMGEQRLWGVRIGVQFYVVWWDPHHKVYPVANG
jgi:hypothetical protein